MTATVPFVEPRAFVRTVHELSDLVLHPWGRALAARPGLLESLVAAGTDPDIVRWNPIPVADRASAEQWLDLGDTRWDGGNVASFAVLSADGELLGNSNLRWTDRDDGLAMVGYWLLPAARGRGVATTVTRAVTSWGIRTAGTRRIELAHAVGNEGSCRVAERCGFPAEGVLRASHRTGDNPHHDEHLHARLATDPEPA
ncbi:GNAT family N-acetyltransferase [Kitasatospora sp. NPDC054939]